MLDRWGKVVRIGWPEHHMLWIQAALDLDRCLHSEAFQDIADMTGRTFCAVQTKAYAMQKARLEAGRARRIMVAGAAHKSVVRA